MYPLAPLDIDSGTSCTFLQHATCKTGHHVMWTDLSPMSFHHETPGSSKGTTCLCRHRSVRRCRSQRNRPLQGLHTCAQNPWKGKMLLGRPKMSFPLGRLTSLQICRFPPGHNQTNCLWEKTPFFGMFFMKGIFVRCFKVQVYRCR